MAWEWHGHGMTFVNRPFLVLVHTYENGMGAAWARHAMCESVFSGFGTHIGERHESGMGTACYV